MKNKNLNHTFEYILNYIRKNNLYVSMQMFIFTCSHTQIHMHAHIPTHSYSLNDAYSHDYNTKKKLHKIFLTYFLKLNIYHSNTLIINIKLFS